MFDSEKPITEASHGEAQSDILGGGMLIMAVLFIAVTIMLIMVLILLVETTKKADAEAQKTKAAVETLEILLGHKLSGQELKDLMSQSEFKEQLDAARQKQKEAETEAMRSASQADNSRTDAVVAEKAQRHAEANAATLQEQLTKLQGAVAKLEQSNMLINSEMRLWIFKRGRIIITEAEPNAKGMWQRIYKCRKSRARLRSTRKGDDQPKGYLLGK